MAEPIDERVRLLKPAGTAYELYYGLARFRVVFGYEKRREARTVRVKMYGHYKSMKYIGLNSVQRPGLRMAQIAVGWFLRDMGLRL